MSWESSDRRERLPADWAQRVRRVKDRDGWRCRWILPSGKRCPRGRATGHRLDVDHRRNDDNHDLENLWCLCEDHHKSKTQKEALAGRRLPPPRKRSDPHPSERI